MTEAGSACHAVLPVEQLKICYGSRSTSVLDVSYTTYIILLLYTCVCVRRAYSNTRGRDVINSTTMEAVITIIYDRQCGLVDGSIGGPPCDCSLSHFLIFISYYVRTERHVRLYIDRNGRSVCIGFINKERGKQIIIQICLVFGDN